MNDLLNDRLNKIAQKRAELDKKEQDERTRKVNTIQYYNRAIKELAPRIDVLLDIAKSLLENNIPIGKRVKAFIGYDEELVTEGINHKLGFYFTYKDRHRCLVGIGIAGGGCCGHDLAVNAFGNMVVSIDPNYNSYQYDGYSDFCCKCKQFLNDFDDFEKRVFQYVDNL